MEQEYLSRSLTPEFLSLQEEIHMAGSTYGTLFSITTWGESHGAGIGVVIDGCPAGLSLSPSHIQDFLDRRKPGQSEFSTPRKEADAVQILSGVFEGKTTGTPISLFVPNTNQHSGDYSKLADVYRPGHADYTFDRKYGFRDYRGGGRSSGRETIGRVAAGAVASRILNTLGISLCTYTSSIGPVSCDPLGFDPDQIRRNALYMPDAEAAARASEYIRQCMKEKDSIGGIIECRVTGLPAGLGDPVFRKLDACLAQAVLSIGAVKGFEIGDGFQAAGNRGSENNDPFCRRSDGSVGKQTNHAGGVLGGISDGDTLCFRAAVKPTPSIARPQQTVNREHQPCEITIGGRHDPVIVPRAVVVVESMAAITILDLLMTNMSATMDHLLRIYR